MPTATTADMAKAEVGEGPPRRAVLPALLVGVAFCAFFSHFLYNQGRISLDPDWSHAYLVPLISAYYILENRQRIFALPVRRNWLGLPVMVAGMALYVFFALGPTWNHSFQGAAMVLTLLGLALLLLGWRMWVALLFPMLYLIMGVRWPPRVLLMVTPTLQLWASQGAYYLLNILGYDADRTGTVITLYHRGQTIPLNVAEACSGMRMIVAFLALGVAVAFLSCDKWWQRGAVIVLGVPVAIFINVLRVATLGIASTINPDWASGQTHMYIGMLWLVPALLLYLAIVWVLQHLFIEEGGAEKRRGHAATQRVAAAPSVSDRSRASQPGGAAFAAGALLLLTGTPAFYGSQHFFDVVLHKASVPLRRSLRELPATVGRWRAVGRDVIMSAEVIEELGTDQYLSRFYAIDGDQANGTLQFDVTYYTGGIDAVPHIPERCFVSGQGLVKAPLSSVVPLQIDRSLWWPDPAADDGEEYWMAQSVGGSRRVARMPRLPDEGLGLNTSEYWSEGVEDRKLAAGYLFLANGGSTPYAERVRLLAFDPSSTHAYYCKVQFSFSHPTRGVSREELGEIAGEFLTLMLPDLMLCLPDWHEVEAGLWPPAPSAAQAGVAEEASKKDA